MSSTVVVGNRFVCERMNLLLGQQIWNILLLLLLLLAINSVWAAH